MCGVFRTVILARLRLPLQLSEARCECGAFLDREGRHRAACARSGKLKTRAQASERSLARVCLGAGATVQYNARLRDMAVAAQDDRAIEVVASGRPLFLGPNWQWTSHSGALSLWLGPHSQEEAGSMALCSRAQRMKRKSSELLQGDRSCLVVSDLETGGRWSEEALQFIGSLAAARAVAHTVVSGAQYLAPFLSRVRWWCCPLRCMPSAELMGAP